MKRYTSILGHLRTLSDREAGTEAFREHCDSVARALMFALMSLDSPRVGSSGDGRSRASMLQGRRIVGMVHDTTTAVRTALQQASHLSSPIPVYQPSEPCDETDVLSTTLPTHGRVEEGEADITQSGNTLEIAVRTDGTIVTFEDFWIGREARVLVHLPSAEASVSIYQRSGRPGFVFGKIEHAIGSINLYFPHESRFSPFGMTRMSVSGGSYQPRSARRYPSGLEGSHRSFSGGGEEFDRFNSNREQDDRDTNPDFWSTPEGRFEAEWRELNERLGENPDALTQTRGLLALSRRYQAGRHEFAAARVAEFEASLATGLYQYAKTLPPAEQPPFMEEAMQLCEGAEEDGQVAERKTNIRRAVAAWLSNSAMRVHREDHDGACSRLRRAIRLLQIDQRGGGFCFRSDVETVQHNLGVILAEKAASLLENPTIETVTEAERLLGEASPLISWISDHANYDAIRALTFQARQMRGRLQQAA